MAFGVGEGAHMVTVKLLVLPLILHVLLIFYIGQKLVRARIKSVRSGQTKISDIAANSDAWPRRLRQIGSNFDSQFHAPTLWYALTAIVVALNLSDYVFVALAWIFLVFRIAHSLVHMGSNDVPTRMRVFLISFMALVAMWLWLAFRLLIMS
jgi:hypothetical protein